MFGPIADLFSRRMRRIRGEIPEYYSHAIKEDVRHRIIGYVADTALRIEPDRLIGHHGYDELSELSILLERQLGKNLPRRVDSHEGISIFLSSCSVEDLLSTVELLCALKVRNIRRIDRYSETITRQLKHLINSINKLFKLEKIGYEIVLVGMEDLPFMVVPYESEFLHVETIKRPLTLMYEEDFKGPINEFETALDEYRLEDYDSCVIEATNAYESTLKTILTRKKIPFDEKKDKIPQLVQKIVSEKLFSPELQTFFESIWPVLDKGPNNIRNLSGIAHGQGEKIKKAQKEYAEFVLRTVGTMIVFLIERYNESK